MKILFLSPIRICRPWTIGERILQSYFLSPVMTFAQLAAQVHDAEVEVLDGQAEDVTLSVFLDRLKGVDVVAISLHSGIEAYDCELNIRIIKEHYPSMVIVLGGYHATYFYKRWLLLGADFVIRHEGDDCFRELVRALDEQRGYAQIQNLAFMKDEKVVVNSLRPLLQDLNALPLPRYDLIDSANYYSCLDDKASVGSIEISRGCVSQCGFCVTRSFWSESYRRKSNARILEELQCLVDCGMRTIWFYATSFGTSHEEDFSLCEEIKKRHLDIQWRTGIRVDTVLKYPDLIEAAAQAGLKMVLVGYESFEEMELEKSAKRNVLPYTMEMFEKAYGILKANDIVVEGSFIIGLSDDVDYMKTLTVQRLQKVCDHLFFQCYRPNIALLTDVTSRDPLDKAYQELFYFHGNISEQNIDRNRFRQKRAIEYRYYLNPVFVICRIFHHRKSIRRMYRMVYAYLVSATMRMFLRRSMPFFCQNGFRVYRTTKRS